MANDQFRRGLVPLSPGGLGTVRTTPYLCSTASDLYLGMPGALDANGLLVCAAVGGSNIQIMGAIVGFQVKGASIHEGDPFLDVSDLSTEQVFALVTDNPDQEYVIQEDTGGSALTQTNIPNAASMLYLGTSGNTDTGWANLELDRSTAEATTVGNLILLRPLDVINQDGTQNTTGNYCKWVVKVLHHQRAGGAWNTPA